MSYSQVFARPLTVTTQTLVRDKPVHDAAAAAAEEDDADGNGEQPFHSGSGTLLGVILPNATV